MKNRIKRMVLFGVLGCLLTWFLLDAQDVRQAVWEGLALCGQSAIPAMFPFLVVSTLLVRLGFGQMVARRLEWLMRPAFGQSGVGASALILGLVGGYPMGGRTVAQLYTSGQLSKEEAQRLLAFTNNSNPAFLVTVLGVGVFGSRRLGLYLWLIHVLSALVVGVMLRLPTPKKPSKRLRPIPPVHLPTALVESVSSSLSAMLSICAFIILFYVLSVPLVLFGGLYKALWVGLLELFSVTSLLTNDAQGFILAAGLSGFGGLSVLCQTAAVLAGSGLSMKWCALGKGLQGGCSALLAGCLVFLGIV